VTLEIHNSNPHVAVLRCRGRIVYGDGADDLLRAVMSQDKPCVQIDLSAVNAIDAGGLGALVAVERWARETHRSVQLTNPSVRIREMLENTGLNTVLNVGLAARSYGDAA
jgi:anti-anti-sigma regulatory factor